MFRISTPGFNIFFHLLSAHSQLLVKGELPLMLSLSRKRVVRITDCPDMTSDVYCGLEARNIINVYIGYMFELLFTPVIEMLSEYLKE